MKSRRRIHTGRVGVIVGDGGGGGGVAIIPVIKNMKIMERFKNGF